VSFCTPIPIFKCLLHWPHKPHWAPLQVCMQCRKHSVLILVRYNSCSNHHSNQNHHSLPYHHHSLPKFHLQQLDHMCPLFNLLQWLLPLRLHWGQLKDMHGMQQHTLEIHNIFNPLDHYVSQPTFTEPKHHIHPGIQTHLPDQPEEA
jgi:hypothetical protein